MFISQYFPRIPCISQEFPVFPAILGNMSISHFFAKVTKMAENLPSVSSPLWGLTTGQPLWVILCHLSEKGRKEIAEEMKERNRVERGTGMKVKKQKK